MATVTVSENAPSGVFFLNEIIQTFVSADTASTTTESVTFSVTSSGDALVFTGSFTPSVQNPDFPASGEIDGIEIISGGESAITSSGLGFDYEDFITSLIALVNNGDGAFLTLVGTPQYTFEGGDIADVFSGGVEADLLRGRAGDDLLVGLEGDDTIDGGGGVDIADYSTNRGGAIFVNLSEGTATDNFGDTDTLISIETVASSTFADIIVGDDGANLLLNFGGDDTVTGGAGNDTLMGNEGFDTFLASAESTNGISANLSLDRIEDGFGDIDEIVDFEGVTGTSFADKIIGGDASELFEGGAGADTLQGKNGDDTLSGAGDNDRISGAAGEDSLSGGDGADTVNGGIDNDVVLGGDGDDKLSGGGGADRVEGGDGNDTIQGGTGQDTLLGGDGDDRILGGGAGDTLFGGAGDDFLRGQAAEDFYVYTEANFGADTLQSYNDSQDLFVINTATGANSFDDLSISQNGEDVEIAFAGGSITVLKRSVTQFDEEDFSFVSDTDSLLT